MYNDRKQIRLVAAWKMRMLERAQRRGYKRKLLHVMNVCFLIVVMASWVLYTYVKTKQMLSFV